MPFSFYLMKFCISIMISAFAGIIMYIVVTRTSTRPLLCLCKRMRRHISFLPANCTVFPVVCLIICRSPYMCMFYCVSSIYCCRASPPPKISTIRLHISPIAVILLLIFIAYACPFFIIYYKYDFLFLQKKEPEAAFAPGSYNFTPS